MEIGITQSGVNIDAVFRPLVMTDFPANIIGVLFSTASNTGIVQFVDAVPEAIGKQKFEQLYMRYVQRWKAAGTPPIRTPAQITEDNAAQLENSNDNLAREFTKIDPVIRYLVTHTPAECAAYVQLNVTNLATAKDMLAKFAMALSVLARQQLK